MIEEAGYRFLVGIDWATEAHQVTVVDTTGNRVAERSVEHSGPALGAFAQWLVDLADADPSRIAVAIETPHGAVVETLVEREIAVYSINPKQLDRFRDRHTVAGAKDDKLDSYVLADSLRTDRRRFHRVQIDDPVIIELREFSRVGDELQQERVRLQNRLREQVFRCFPQLLPLCPAADEPWFWALVERAPTPDDAKSLRRRRVTALLRQYRIRRLNVDTVWAALRQPPVHVAAGTYQACAAHIRLLLPRLVLLTQQQQECERQIERLLEHLGSLPTDEGQKNEHRDVEIVLSIPGIGTQIAATMLSEAAQAIAERDYYVLRAISGVAPVTRRSGKSKIVLRRYACNPRLATALYHAARVHVQHDQSAKTLYAALRRRGKTHGRALRTVADRMLRIMTAMLRDRSLYDRNRMRPISVPATLTAAA